MKCRIDYNSDTYVFQAIFLYTFYGFMLFGEMKPILNKTFQNLPKDKQDRITKAAVLEFSEKGYSGASINTIVDKLGIAKGSIFQYFGDKKGLFLFIFNRTTDLVKNRLRIIRDDTDDVEVFSRLEKTLWAGINFLNDQILLHYYHKHLLYYREFFLILHNSISKIRRRRIPCTEQHTQTPEKANISAFFGFDRPQKNADTAKPKPLHSKHLAIIVRFFSCFFHQSGL